MRQLQGFHPSEVLPSEKHLGSNVELFAPSVPAAFVYFLATRIEPATTLPFLLLLYPQLMTDLKV